MKLIALDTSSDACSVALSVDADVIERHSVEPREHTRLLVPMIEEVLRARALELADLDAIVIGNGPGSFIGVRIAAAIAQGMAFSLGLEVVPVSSLAAVAAEVFATGNAERVLVAQDARMHEIYLAEFARDAAGLPVAVGEVRLHPAADPVGEGDTPAVAAGAGWERYPELLEASRTRLADLAEVRFPRARYALAIGRRDLDSGLAIAPADLEPAYVRTRVAAVPTPPGRAT